MKRAPVRDAIRDLEDAGELIPVEVPGLEHRRSPGARRGCTAMPAARGVEAAALLSPFDPVVWFRPRTERLFDFHYRIEIYTPAPDRKFGYYSLPVLIDDDVVGRVDLKSDRKAGVLRVQSAWAEPSAPAETRRATRAGAPAGGGVAGPRAASRSPTAATSPALRSELRAVAADRREPRLAR